MKRPYTMAGQCGGWVFQNTRHGQVCYQKFIPANPNSPGQARVRKNFKATAKRWRALGEWRRQLWDEGAATKKTRKRLGQCGPMTGWNYHIQVNQRRANRGLSPLDLPPEYLQRLQGAVAAAIATAGATQPLLGPALFLQANRLVVAGTGVPVGAPLGLPPPRPGFELARS